MRAVLLVALLAVGAGEAKVLAGGQSLVPLLKLRFAAPELMPSVSAMSSTLRSS